MHSKIAVGIPRITDITMEDKRLCNYVIYYFKNLC